MKPSYEQIASDFSLWGEYVDPQGLDSLSKFESMSTAEKIEFQVKCFGPEEADEG
jgi:hypothetical protein